MALIILDFYCENTFNDANGSDPGDSTKINGEVDDESRYISARLNAGGRMNSSPSVSLTNNCTAGMSLSGLIILKMHSL